MKERTMQYIDYYESPLGVIELLSDGDHLTGLSFNNDSHLEDAPENHAGEAARSAFETTKRWLDQYFQGEAPDFTPPLRITGSDFRKMVCEIMSSIPYGQTMTYGEIAAIVARRRGIARMSAQAVGGAVGHNPVSIIVPCHRVVGANGSLTGYGGGMDRKVALLELEKVDMTKLFVPTKGTAL